MLQWGIRQSAEVSNNLTSVERILEYTKLPKESDSGNIFLKKYFRLYIQYEREIGKYQRIPSPTSLLQKTRVPPVRFCDSKIIYKTKRKKLKFK